MEINVLKKIFEVGNFSYITTVTILKMQLP